jgi:hypothetical protein
MTLDEAKAYLGSKVAYLPRVGEPEHGVITGVNDTYVFVLYLGDRTAKATRPADLKLLATGHTCWCGGQVGHRVPGDRDGLGCLEDIHHDWKGGDR